MAKQKKQTPCHAFKSMEQARDFELTSSLLIEEGGIVVALPKKLFAKSFLDKMALKGKKSPFPAGFNLSAKYCYVRVTKSSVRVWHREGDIFMMCGYDVAEDKSPRDIYLLCLEEAAVKTVEAAVKTVEAAVKTVEAAVKTVEAAVKTVEAAV